MLLTANGFAVNVVSDELLKTSYVFNCEERNTLTAKTLVKCRNIWKFFSKKNDRCKVDVQISRVSVTVTY